jgi:hypothetical protein
VNVDLFSCCRIAPNADPVSGAGVWTIKHDRPLRNCRIYAIGASCRSAGLLRDQQNSRLLAYIGSAESKSIPSSTCNAVY